jgi:hypothetical protein
MSLNIHYLQSYIGGKNGGINITSGVATATYNYIIVESGVTFTVLEDNLANDLLTDKNLIGLAFVSERLLSAGTGKTIKKLTFTGGLVWGYTIETSIL